MLEAPGSKHIWNQGGVEMAILIGGIVALVLGVILGAIWWSPVLSIIGGVVPVLLLMGGGIAIYLGIDEMRYPSSKAYPAPEPAKAEPPEASVAKGKGPRYWLMGYSVRNVEVVQKLGIIALPSERAEIIEKMMSVGDRVILYALSPGSRFAGVVEVEGEPARSSDMPFVPPKKGEIWDCRRKVRPVALPPSDKWVDAEPLLDKLELMREAKKAGKSLVRSFAAKLREVPQLSAKDYERISKALGA
jgi:predicted RNA-binding protein